VHHGGLSDDVTILDELTDGLACKLIPTLENGSTSRDLRNGIFGESKNVREFAIEISLTSLGSSQIFFWPHFITLAARRF
jgi:hypothetical protein